MAKKKQSPQNSQSLEEALTSIRVSGEEALKNLRDLQVLQGTLLQHETARLKKRHGTDSPRVQHLEQALKHNREQLKNLNLQVEVTNIKVPEMEEEGALLHGRVVDEAHRGYPGLAIVMESEEGKLLRTYGTAKTDASGYYALPLSMEVVSKLIEGKLAPAYFAVRDRKGKALYREFEPFSIQAGEQQVLDIAIPRAELGITHTPPPTGKKPPPKGKKPPPKEKKAPPKKETWLVEGRVIYEDKTPLVGAKVSAYDKDVSIDDTIGSALTNSKGRFKIEYNPQEFREGKETGPDLYLEVSDPQGKKIHSTIDELRENASPKETYTIVVKSKDKIDPNKTLPSKRKNKDDGPDKKDEKKG